jgi:ribosomal protein S18 acetylase RimI-like enzyme
LKTQASNSRTVSLRPVVPADEPFLLKVYASTRAEEMALVPWTDEQRHAFVEMQFKAQLEHYAKAFPAATHDIVLENDRPVGRLYVDRLDQEINIIDFTVLPEERNSGIGSYVMQEILEEAKRSGKTVGIYVETFNPSVAFFKRLGFLETEENGIHFRLQWFPAEDQDLTLT